MSENKLPYTIAIDFDGTLCEDAWPDIGKPRTEVIQAAKNHKEHGHKLILWTCREGEMLDAALEWCKGYWLEFDAVNANLPERIEAYRNDCRKISADEYWDDKTVDYKSAVNSPFIWNAYKRALNVIEELLKEQEDTCDFCKNDPGSCKGRDCEHFIMGDVVECNGRIMDWSWTCMDCNWGECPKLEITPCYGCVENNNRGFEMDYDKVVRYLEESK